MGELYRKGFGNKAAVRQKLADDFHHSDVVRRIKASDFRLDLGDVSLHMAREMGFCYGVERTVQYAYETLEQFPDRDIYITDEIIHNPQVNEKLIDLGMKFLYGRYSCGKKVEELQPSDIVLIPAFGVPVVDMTKLKDRGCILVDTTCGSVLNVWKNVTRYAQDGFTAIIHGKVKHEETRATASQALKFPRGRYLVVLDKAEAGVVCDYIRHGGDREAFIARFGAVSSPGFDPDVDLVRVGCANQTTMLMSESLEIGEMFRSAMTDRYGEAALAAHFRAFDTICSATQERQDAVEALLGSEPLDLMIVVGGYNSSNTCNLARICASRVRTYHVADPDCLLSAERIRHRPVGAPSTAQAAEVVTENWLPATGRVVIGLTAGASTPNNIVGQVIETLERFASA